MINELSSTPLIDDKPIESITLIESYQDFFIDNKVDSTFFVFTNTFDQQSFYFKQEDFSEINQNNFYYIGLIELETLIKGGKKISFSCIDDQEIGTVLYNPNLTNLINRNEDIIFLTMGDALDPKRIPIYIKEDGRVIIPLYTLQKKTKGESFPEEENSSYYDFENVAIIE